MNDSSQQMMAWLRLMSEAMGGTEQAQQAFAALSRSPEAMEAFRQWFGETAVFAPGVELPTAVSQPEAFTKWLETWQKAMGVVPRARYLELLEKADRLQRRVEQLEELNRQLQTLLEGREQQEENVQRAADMWGQMMQQTLKTQAAWMEPWSKAAEEGKSAEEASAEEEDEEDTA